MRFPILFLASVTPVPALAVDIGIVRTPEWMDPYLILLLGLNVGLFLIVLATKPPGVPFSDLRKIELRGAARTTFMLAKWTYILSMAFFFAGMLLVRL